VTLKEFQQLIERIYHKKDAARGIPGSYMWFAEEVGELSRALRRGERDNLEEEFADCLAWLTTLASLAGVDLQQAALRRYDPHCPYCEQAPCACPEPA